MYNCCNHGNGFSLLFKYVSVPEKNRNQNSNWKHEFKIWEWEGIGRKISEVGSCYCIFFTKGNHQSNWILLKRFLLIFIHCPGQWLDLSPLIDSYIRPMRQYNCRVSQWLGGYRSGGWTCVTVLGYLPPPAWSLSDCRQARQGLDTDIMPFCNSFNVLQMAAPWAAIWLHQATGGRHLRGCHACVPH